MQLAADIKQVETKFCQRVNLGKSYESQAIKRSKTLTPFSSFREARKLIYSTGKEGNAGTEVQNKMD